MLADAGTVADWGEDRLVARIARSLGQVPPGIQGIGDDAALVPGGPATLLTTDVLVEGSHFRREWSTPREVGAKALSVNLSDIAAMGGRPRFALVSLILPPQTRVASVLALFAGLRRAALSSGTLIVGGNLARGAPLSVTVALVGEALPQGPVFRSGARPGDRLFVTGTPGLARAGWLLLERMTPRTGKGAGTRASARHDDSSDRDPWEPARLATLAARRRRFAAGFPGALGAMRRFLLPQARLAAAAALVQHHPGALIDLSDGLARDLPRLAAASGVGMVVYRRRLPVSPTFRRLCDALGESPDRMILGGGEDYELAFTLSARHRGAFAEIGGVPVAEIGVVTADRGVQLRDAGGRLEPWPVLGFDHFG